MDPKLLKQGSRYVLRLSKGNTVATYKVQDEYSAYVFEEPNGERLQVTERLVTSHVYPVKALPGNETTSEEKPRMQSTKTQVGGDHYQTAIQPIEYIMANRLPFCEGNVVKYITRHRKKNGAEDLLKARQYIDFILEREYGLDLNEINP